MLTRNNGLRCGVLTLAALAAALLAGCATPGKRPESAALLWPEVISALQAEEATGPTLSLDYGQGDARGDPVSNFMYFVPLISPEPVTVTQTPGNTQRAHVTTAERKFTATTFAVTCDFTITGAGRQQNAFDYTEKIRRHEQRLKQGGSLERLLSNINLEGSGCGSVEVEGTITNRVPAVSEVRLRFNAHGHSSPVTIGLHDIQYHQGAFVPRNELVARVNTITFRREAGGPKMHVTVASVHRKEARGGLWQDFVGGVKGIAANLLIKPISVEPAGHKAMLDFGLALAAKAPTFTFPRARNLKDPDPPKAADQPGQTE